MIRFNYMHCLTRNLIFDAFEQPGALAPATSLFRTSSSDVALAMAQRLGEYHLQRAHGLMLTGAESLFCCHSF